MVAMVLSTCVVCTLKVRADNSAVITVSTVEAKSGEEVNVEVGIKQNPGVLGGILTIRYDDGLMLTGISNGEAFSALAMTLPGEYVSGCKILWDSVFDTATQDGVIMILTFTVSRDVELSTTQVISIIVNDLVDEEVNSIEASVVSGGVTVSHSHELVKINAVPATYETAGNIEYYTCSLCGKYFDGVDAKNEIKISDTVVEALSSKSGFLLGDVNGDNAITPADAATVFQMIDEHQYREVADVNGDGCVSEFDAVEILCITVRLAESFSNPEKARKIQ